MNREQLKELGLSDEQIDAVMKEHGKVVNATKAQVDSLTTERDDLQAQIADRDSQLEELGKTAGLTDELKQQITQLQQDNATAKEQYEAELQDIKLSSAIKTALTGKVHDEDLVAGLFDREKLVINGDKIVGLDEQLKTLQESKAFLFKTEESQQPGFRVGSSGQGAGQAGEDQLASIFGNTQQQ